MSTSQFHGGQSWRNASVFKEDFSVTTNALGTPQKALEAARCSLDNVHHYPAQDFEPALTKFATWLCPQTEELDSFRKRVLLGNGLSELIDLAIRSTPHGNGQWRSGPYPVQYMEYERSAGAQQRVKVGEGDFNLMCLVNPSNPTGDWMDIETLKQWIEETAPTESTVIVDESMLMWYGENWREQSLVSQAPWIQRMLSTKDIRVFSFHSWTKIWSCPGLRIGSLVAPSEEDLIAIKKLQVPWSLNTAALAFLEHVVDDQQYLEDTWEKTTAWRTETVELLLKHHPEWKVYGEKWLSWIWVDVGTEEEALKVVAHGEKHGFPLRYGGYGYKQHTCVRFAVREPRYYRELAQVLAEI